MNFSNANFTTEALKSRIRLSSTIILLLWFVPFIIVCLFINPDFIIEVAFWSLLYCCSFGIVGISGLIISKNDNPAYFRILRILIICFLVYCALCLGVCLFFFIGLLIAYLHGNFKDGLEGGIVILFMIWFGFGIFYFLIAAWMGLRDFRASKMISDLLMLGEYPGVYQQPLAILNFQAANPVYYQSQFNAGNPNFYVQPPIMNNP